MFRRRFASLLLSTLISTPALASITGVYVANDPGSALLVQIVQTPDGRLSGRMEAMTVDTSGKLRDRTSVIEGAADHGEVTLSPKSPILLGAAPSMTGHLSGDQLTLSWGGSNYVLKRSGVAAFDIAAQKLKVASLEIKAFRKREAQIAARQALSAQLGQRVTALRTELDSLNEATPSAAALFRADGDRYDELAAEIRHRKRQEKAIGYFDTPDAVGRNVRDKYQRAWDDRIDVHNEAISLNSTLRGRIVIAHREATAIQALCAGQTTDASDTLTQSCLETRRIDSRLQTLAQNLRQPFEEAEQVYQTAPLSPEPVGRQLLSKLLH
jgi:hypothetical protein